MIQVFCDQRGSGKTKELIRMANDNCKRNKGNIVYIDDDNRVMFELDNKIRFINASDFKIDNYDSFYGFLCGILSEDYDIEEIYIDGLSNIIKQNLQNAAHLFYWFEMISEKHDVDFYININRDTKVPEFILKYVA